MKTSNGELGDTEKASTITLDCDSGERRDPSLNFELGSKFEIEEVIGCGGMGTVLRVRHKALDQKRAIKVLNAIYGKANPKGFERLRREAMIASDLSHPSVVRVFDFDVTERGQPYIVMEYLEGSDLEQLLKERGRLKLEETVQILAGAANALDEVHQRGVVHRDLKPANLFVTGERITKILDFGISHVDRARLRLTNPGELMGTPIYMAPEQFRGEGVGAWSDIYALAAVAYEMLTGEPVFKEDTPGLIIAAVLEQTPRPAGETVPELPLHVQDALSRGLAKIPEERHGTAWEFIGHLAGSDLDTMLADSNIFMTPSSILGLETGTLKQREKTLRWLPGGGIALLVLIAGFLGAQFDWFGLAGVDPPPTIIVRQFSIEGEMSRKEWTNRAMTEMLSAYLALDDCVEAVRIDKEDEKAARTDASRATPILDTSVRYAEEKWEMDFSLDVNNDGIPEWRYSGHGGGYEELIEEATWSLHFDFTEERYEPKKNIVGIRCDPEDLECRRSRMARAAVINHGLLARVDRLIQVAEHSGEVAIWWDLSRLMKCVATTAARDCLAVKERGPLEKSDVPLMSALWKLFGDQEAQQSGMEELCALKEADRVARGIVNLLPSKIPCADSKETTCATLETFLDRLACMSDSGLRDAPGIAAEYTKQIMDKDWANSVYANSFSVLREESEGNRKAHWYERMRNRYGTSERLLAEGSFMSAMVERNSTAALIWARRTTAPDWREGLALQLGGWLRSGIERSARGAAEIALKRGELSEWEKHLLIRPAVQPVLLAGSQVLAEVWLNAIDDVGIREEAITAARKLVEALAKGNRDICIHGVVPGSTFEVEQLFYCEDWERLAGTRRSGNEKGQKGLVSRYYVAQALLKTGCHDDAMQEFTRLESDPMARALLPLSALYAVERISHIEREHGNKKRGCERLVEFLSLWDGLDVPLENYMEARDSLEACSPCLSQ